MLVGLGEARGRGADRRLAWSLAAIAGALNTAGFYAVGLYSSHMTGNVSALADYLALADLSLAAVHLTLIVTFISGAVVSALLINAGRRRQIAGIYAFSILAEAVLLAALGGADVWLSEVGRSPLLAYGLSFIMGLQNAVVTRISNARIRTTHVTGMVTDIGIELGNLADLAWHRGQRGRQDAAEYNKDKLWLHGVTVLAFLGGGMIAVLTYKSYRSYLLFGAALLLLLLALPGIVAPPASGQAGRQERGRLVS